MPTTKHEQGQSGAIFAKSYEERPMKRRFGKTTLVRTFGTLRLKTKV